MLIAPELNFGVSPYFLDYPGTISLRSETMLRVVEDLITSLYRHGFRKIVILNGHSGNSTVKDSLVELANRMDGLKIVFYSWWESHGVAELARKHNLRPEHASWMEAFYFTRVGRIARWRKAAGPGDRFVERCRNPRGLRRRCIWWKISGR